MKKIKLKGEWPKFYFILLVISSFGPYVFKGVGVRLEQIFIYPAFVLAFLLLIFNADKYKIKKNLFIFTTIWAIAFLWISIISFSLSGQAIGIGALAPVENFLQPLAIMTLFIVLSRYYRLQDYFFVILKTFLVALGINSLIIMMQIIIDPELFGILDKFVRTRQDTTVAERAAGLGRFLGIYGQPIEAGASYSLGLLSWVYLENIRRNFSFWQKYTLLLLIFLGGLITVSKVFVVGGFVLFIGYVLFFSRSGIRKRFLYSIPFLFGIIAYYLVTSMWQGLNYLLRLFNTSGSSVEILARLTAGRIGEESGVFKLFEKIYRDSPIYGYGFAPPPTLDNGFAEFFYHGGMVGLIFYLILLFWLLYKGLAFYFKRRNHNAYFLFVATLIFGLNIGAPAFTLNRFSVISTMTICFLFLLQKDKPIR